jgi:hypothetical protein
MGRTRPPQGAKPIPRLISTIMALGFAIAGADLILYRFIHGKFRTLTPDRQAFFVGTFVMLAWALGNLFAGLNAHPDSALQSLSSKSVGYRFSAFKGAFVCLVFGLFLMFLALTTGH